MILALYAEQESRAAAVLEANGISRDLFETVLDVEPGPSPAGIVSYTSRAMMIGGQAVLEAERAGAEAVNELHLLLGTIAESRRWEQHAWGPHHLRAAAEKSGTSLDALEQDTRAALSDQ